MGWFSKNKPNTDTGTKQIIIKAAQYLTAKQLETSRKAHAENKSKDGDGFDGECEQSSEYQNGDYADDAE